jgi:hypothetical protein
MAKKTEDAFEKFLATVLAATPEESRAKVEEALRIETLRPVIGERVLAKDDYSRAHDALREERQRFEAEVNEAKTRIDGWQDWYGKTAQELAQLREKAQTYESTYGTLDPSHPQPRYVTADDIDKRLNETLQGRDAAAIAFADQLTDVKIDHFRTWGEKLNTKDFLKFADQAKLPLDLAYDRYTQERRDAKAQTDLEEKLKQAREEGAREYASKNRLPVLNSQSEPHPLDAAPTIARNPIDRVAAAVADWNSTQHSGTF